MGNLIKGETTGSRGVNFQKVNRNYTYITDKNITGN